MRIIISFIWLLFSSLSFGSFAQNMKEFTGTWTYNSILHKTKNDSEKNNIKELLYQDLKLVFHTDGTYSSEILKRNDRGNWKFDSDKSLITLRSTSGAFIDLKVIQITEEALVIEISNEIISLIPLITK